MCGSYADRIQTTYTILIRGEMSGVKNFDSQLFDAQPGLRYAPVILIQFATMSCTTIWSRQKRARELGRPDPSSDATHAALQIFSLVGKLGRPYRASTQHVGMLDNLRSKLMASRPTVSLLSGKVLC